MAVELKPGTVVQVTVKRTPTNEAAAKTLSRIFAKDPANRRLRPRRKKLLAGAIDIRRRGGRPWEVRSKAPRLIRPTKGAACSLAVTVDLLPDLRSVERFIEIKAKS